MLALRLSLPQVALNIDKTPAPAGNSTSGLLMPWRAEWDLQWPFATPEEQAGIKLPPVISHSAKPTNTRQTHGKLAWG